MYIQENLNIFFSKKESIKMKHFLLPIITSLLLASVTTIPSFSEEPSIQICCDLPDPLNS